MIGQRAGRRIVVALAAGVAVGLYVLGVNPAVSQTQVLEARMVDDGPGLDPDASEWDRAPAIEVPMTAQAVAYPLGGGSVPLIDVRAIHDGDTLYLRLEWEDPTVDDSTVRAEEFSDAVAVELPSEAGSSVPAVCMGQADNGVNIWQWRADRGEGLPADVADLHPDGYVDQYQSTDDVFFPAREAGNPVADTEQPVQNLVAQGPGSLAPAETQPVQGRGRWRDGRWSVVVARPFAAESGAEPSFALAQPVDVAFAVWNGSEGDRNGQKSVSSFVRLEASEEGLPDAPISSTAVAVVLAGVLMVAGLYALGSVFFSKADAP